MAQARPELDLFDIQGNILRGYARFPFAQFMLYRMLSPSAGRMFLQSLTRLVTPGEWGESRPSAAINLGLSHAGLTALALPSECLSSFPVEFKEGMKARARRLGDVGDSDPRRWDPPWNSDPVHLVVMVYAESGPQREEQCRQVSTIVENLNNSEGSVQVAPLQHQDCQWPTVDGRISRKEHFGFVDGISNPDVEGMPSNGAGVDVGNPDDVGVFRRVPAGEFILGYPGEGGEVAPMPLPHLLGTNASYLVIRKLEQDVEAFKDFLADQSRLLKGVASGVDPKEFLAAKIVGRWRDGSPLVRHPHRPPVSNGEHPRPDNTFNYAADMAGAACPLGAHIRRAYPRDSLGFGGRMVRRRRLIRRSIPYGGFLGEAAGDTAGKEAVSRTASRGIMFLAYNSGFDQFEFVQQAWIGQGDDFQQGNDMDPLVGSQQGRRMIIPGDEESGRPPFLCFEIPRFVHTRGGEYFFVPSLTGLRLLASDQVAVS